MDTLRLALIQIRGVAGDRDGNVANAVARVDELCADQPPDLILLPEFFNTDYFPQYRDYDYLELAEHETDYTLTAMARAARRHGVFLVAPIYEREAPGLFYDTAVVFNDRGEIQGKYRKVHPAAGASLEKLYFAPGNTFPVFSIRDWNVGIMICYDTYFPEAARTLALKGAELIAVPFATTSDRMKNDLWTSLHRARAVENECYIAACNKVGKDGDFMMGGCSLVVNPVGEVMRIASGTDEEVIQVTLDKHLIDEARAWRPLYRDRRPECYTCLTQTFEEIRGLA
jgi:N-carbamoylputrescine amidase